MKSTAIVTALTISLLSSSAIAHSSNKHQFVAKDDSIGTEICLKAAEGKNFQFAQLLKEHHIKKSYVVSKLKCNDEVLPQFVASYGNDADRILRMLPLNRAHVTIQDIARVEWEQER